MKGFDTKLILILNLTLPKLKCFLLPSYFFRNLDVLPYHQSVFICCHLKSSLLEYDYLKEPRFITISTKIFSQNYYFLLIIPTRISPSFINMSKIILIRSAPFLMLFN